MSGKRGTDMANVDEPGDFFAALEDQRQALGLTQRDLCKRAGLSHSAYWYAASRGSDIGLKAALRYCNVLGLRLKVVKGAAK